MMGVCGSAVGWGGWNTEVLGWDAWDCMVCVQLTWGSWTAHGVHSGRCSRTGMCIRGVD